MDNTANFQINVDGNVFAAIQNLFVDFTKIVQVVENVNKSVVDSTKQITKQVDQTTDSFGGLRKTIKQISLTSVIEQTKQVAEVLADISAPGIGFEQSMADLSSITGIAGKELQELSLIARQTGKDSGLGAKGAADAFAVLASQIQVDKIGMEGLQNLQARTITLSHAAGMSMNDAALGLAGTINQFGLQASEADRVINVLAAGSKYGAAEIMDLSQSFKVVGAAAAAAGLSVEDTAGAVEVLSKNNLKGAEAGTALRNIVLKMQTTLGVDFSKNSLSEALDALKPKLTDATYLSEVFGMENIAAAQFLIKNAEAVAKMTEQVTGTNVAYEQAAIRTDTVQQMMARCRANVDDLKISFFDLTGSVGGYATIIAEQAVTVAQLLPLFSLMAKGIKSVTNAQKLQSMWTGIVNGATAAWAGVQWVLNASLWACPITWIVAGVMALVAIITVCVTKIQGWGAQWDSVVNFMKLTFQIYVESIRLQWSSMINGIMIGLDYIKMGWYKFKEACGLGDSNENKAMISQIGVDIEQRQQAIIDGATKIKDLTEKAANSLTWEMSWKKGEKESDVVSGADTPITDKATQIAPTTQTDKAGGGSVLNPKKKGKGSGNGAGTDSKGNILDLNKIIPDLKGSTAYTAIASHLATVKIPAIATPESVAMPSAVATTMLPSTAPQNDPATLGGEPDWNPNQRESVGRSATETGSKGNFFDLKKIIPDLKDSIASRLSAIKMPAIAAAASVAMPLTVAATSLPQTALRDDPTKTEYMTQGRERKSVNVAKFCDKIEIHIANADNKGYQQIQTEVANVLKQVLDDYEA